MHPAVRLSSRTLAAAGALALLAGLGACTTETTPNLGFGKRPLWTADDIGVETLSGAVLTDDIALVPGTEYSGGSLAAVDVHTGQVRWSADDGDPLVGGDGLVADHNSPHEPIQPTIQELDNGDWNVLIPYRSVTDPSADSVPVDDASAGEEGRGATRYGIAAISGSDGRLRWASEPMLRLDEDSSATPAVRAVATDRGTVLAAAGIEGENGSLTTWALDADSGRTRWTEDDVWPTALTAGRAIVETAQDGNGIWSQDGPDRENSTVRALDASDGRQVWDLSDRYPESGIDVHAGGYLVTHVTVPESEREPGDSENATLLLRADNGKVAERIGDFDLCHADDPLIVCQPDDGLRVFRTDTPRLATEESKPFGDSSSWEILSVSGEIIVVNDRTGDEERLVALDPSGEVISDELLAAPVTMSDDHAVFCTKESRGCGVYGAAGRKPDPPAEPAVDDLAVGKALWGRQEGSWGSGAADMTLVNGVELVTDAVIYQGSLRRSDRDATVVAEAENGETRWQLHQDNAARTVDGERVRLQPPILGVPRIAETDDQWSMLLPYESDDASGIAALSGRDGAVAWTVPLGDPGDDIDINDVGRDRAAVTVTPEAEGSEPTGWVVDLRTHEAAWSRHGATVFGVTPDLALTRAPSVGDSEAITALEVTDPERKRWSFGDREQAPELVGVFGDLVVLRVTDGSVVLDLASGDQLARIGKPLTECDGEAKLVACDTSVEVDSLPRPGAPVILRATDSGVRITELRGVRSTEVNGVHQRRIFLDATQKLGYRSVDENGTSIDTRLPGRFEHASAEGYVLFTSGQPFANVMWDVRRLR